MTKKKNVFFSWIWVLFSMLDINEFESRKMKTILFFLLCCLQWPQSPPGNWHIFFFCPNREKKKVPVNVRIHRDFLSSSSSKRKWVRPSVCQWRAATGRDSQCHTSSRPAAPLPSRWGLMWPAGYPIPSSTEPAVTCCKICIWGETRRKYFCLGHVGMVIEDISPQIFTVESRVEFRCGHSGFWGLTEVELEQQQMDGKQVAFMSMEKMNQSKIRIKSESLKPHSLQLRVEILKRKKNTGTTAVPWPWRFCLQVLRTRLKGLVGHRRLLQVVHDSTFNLRT